MVIEPAGPPVALLVKQLPDIAYSACRSSHTQAGSGLTRMACCSGCAWSLVAASTEPTGPQQRSGTVPAQVRQGCTHWLCAREYDEPSSQRAPVLIHITRCVLTDSHASLFKCSTASLNLLNSHIMSPHAGMATPGALSVERRPGGVAIVVLAREPANVMNLPFWQGLTRILDELEADTSVHGVIFTSGLKRDIFTAGVALPAWQSRMQQPRLLAAAAAVAAA